MFPSRFAQIALAAVSLAPAAAAAQYGAGREVTFTIRVENVSTPKTLKLSNGTTAPAPTAPLLWTITDEGNPLFTPGQPDRGQGLERLAEDGNPGVLADYIVQNLKSVVHSGVVTVPSGDKGPGPITPGKAYEFTISAAPGQRLTLAMMFGQSNDLFYAPGPEAIALFDAKGKPLTTDVTSSLQLWDAGTEVNEEPGLGPDQAPRQAAPNTGPAEHGKVTLVKDQFQYPSVREVVRVSVRPSMATAAAR
ncbi:MAG TPA: spondin domain-containing protein [Gemmatimonadaceae bacterium]|nr:spondin domain-containing protein [Gemmatimonadaceae bacterium]